MPLDITFTLSDRDLDRFKTVAMNARSQASEQQSPAEIEKAAYKIVDVAMNSDLPDFVADRLLELKILLDMMRDDEWQLSEQDKKRVISALAYFADPIDLIPDHIPGIGFLDDAMFVEIVMRELRAEVEAYNEFVEFRRGEEEKLSEQGQDPQANREQWLGPKRDELHSRIEATRGKREDDDEFTFHFL